MTETAPTQNSGDASPHWKSTVAWFLAGQAVSLLGSGIVAYAVIWWVALETNSPTTFAVLGVVAMVPQGIMSVFAGVWADRYSRKHLIIYADAGIAVATLAMVIYFLLNQPSLVVLGAGLLVRSIGGGIQQPNVGAILPQITPTAQLMRVNSLNQAIQAAVLVASPALAGVLLTFVDLAWILSIDIVTAGVAIAILASIKIPRLAKPQDHKPAVFREIAAAAHHAFHIPGLARVLALFAGLWLIIMPPAQLSPIVVVRLFGSEQWKLATIEVAFSIGMVVGGALLAAWGGLSNRMTMLLVTAAAWSALTLAQGLSPNFAIYAALWAVFGVSAPGLSATSMTVAQEKVAPAMLGRVMGLLSLVMALAGPIGMLAISPLADLVGIRAILVGAGALALLFTAALAWRAPAIPAPAIPAPAIPAPAIPVPQAEP